MSLVWRPTALGRLFTSAERWSLALDGTTLTLELAGQTLAGSAERKDAVEVIPGALWSTLRVRPRDGRVRTLAGLANRDAVALLAALAGVRAEARSQRREQAEIARLERDAEAALAWVEAIESGCDARLRSHGRLDEAFLAGLPECPAIDRLPERLGSEAGAAWLAARPRGARQRLRRWPLSLQRLAEAATDRHVARALKEDRAFLDRVERSPLTDEQARAVVCFDSRVLLVAAAGSGKTATMVAKAGYALHKGWFGEQRVLLLAFNGDAAAELRARVEARLAPLGLPLERVAARTFHAFGLEVIAEATGRRPPLAPWVEAGRDQEAFLSLVDGLKDRDAGFRADWDMFRLVLAEDLPAPHEAHDGGTGSKGSRGAGDARPAKGARPRRPADGFETLAGETVASAEERLLADWLFYHGVAYRWEPGAAPGLGGAFRLPALDARLQLKADDDPSTRRARGGEPRTKAADRRTQAAGRREQAADRRDQATNRREPATDRREPAGDGTLSIAVSEGDLWSGRAFAALQAQLARRGVALDPNPDRPVRGRRPPDGARLASTFRAFLAHAKSTRLRVDDLRARLTTGSAGRFRLRHEAFLSLFEPLWAAWEARLAREGCIDFEDMLNLAADCVEDGRYRNPWGLVMVDEFQDASRARGRLAAALAAAPGRCLFAVGDDWQAINRFAGADLAMMTGFERAFGPARVMRLQTTFRCPQALCDLSSAFVQRNPAQIPKKVVSARGAVQGAVRLVRVPREAALRTTVAERIERIRREAATSGIARVSVLVLGRYRRDRELLPDEVPGDGPGAQRRGTGGVEVSVRFLTVHAAKGLEADHVIVPRLVRGTLGFPSGMVDDPLLRLVMPEGDAFEHAEERRLFYVALTRARSTVTLLTVRGRESPFVDELVETHGLRIEEVSGAELGATRRA